MKPPLAGDLIQRALDYAQFGWSVVPLRHRTKLPLIRWEEFERRAATEDEIREWWHAWPDANIAVVTGRVSGLAVVDADPRHDGESSLMALQAEHGTLPMTIEAMTGGGGRHLYFALPDIPLRSRTAFAPGLDLRAEGGLVVAPPSIHSSGRAYAWRPGCGPGEWPLAPLPAWLVAIDRPDAVRQGHPASYWRDLVRTGVVEGMRNSTVASLTGHLLRHGVDPGTVLELLLCWNLVRCRPPLADDEVTRTVASITRTHGRSGGGPGG